ncbi:hypothetical protein COT42_01265 [Candidatus Saganbacteria bacterium CG08_land_8_20_14_0_20_45_16]|uniref:histidine kinase n=1 Tax=Candidatus Saganbacteria bacterium CG08_land_8_20_14_0_20_45_16 TaxID=2014293 RepID=A0A2H0Y3E2_UNCSA|nr:MAG: hypothetical protein COT42_01265 [Candidatus Saganbacteria bacterium CG08_land_8_20_14_0_20_45_16]
MNKDLYAQKFAELKKEEDQLLINDIKEKSYWGIWIRYLIVVLGFLMFGFSFLRDMPLSLWLLLFVLFYNIMAHLLLWFKQKPGLRQITMTSVVFLAFDTLAITFLIYITGWVESPYWFLYLVLIVVSGFGMFSYYSLSVFIIALFSAVFYLVLLALAFLQIIPIYGASFNLSPRELLLVINNKAVFTTVSIFLFAATIYYFAKLLSQHRQELSQKNMELLVTLEKMKDVDRLKDDFVSTSSHELRTPLSIIRENISLIIDGVLGKVNETQQKLLVSSQSNVDRLARILDNLLDISRIESRLLTLNMQETNLVELVDKVVAMFKGRTVEKEIAVKLDCPEPIVIWCDPEQMLRVYINLIDNAIKYTERGGEIIIGVGYSDDKVVSFVQDNGVGLGAEDLSKIFERFVRIHPEDEASPKGTGLGLSICKGIIEMHGGNIWAESQKGVGAKFIFVLPRRRKHGERKS